MNQRLVHDVAHATAIRILGVIENCLREEERRDAYAEFYAIIREELNRYEVLRQRLRDRLGK